MKLILPLACCLAVALPASAQVYQWKDASGRTVISDTPPPGSAKGSRPVASESVATTGGDAKSLAEKDMEFRKRRLDAKEKADKDAKEQSVAAAMKDNCERSRRQLAALEAGNRMVTYDDKGERRVMEDAERQQEIERARKFIADNCK